MMFLALQGLLWASPGLTSGMLFSGLVIGFIFLFTGVGTDGIRKSVRATPEMRHMPQGKAGCQVCGPYREMDLLGLHGRQAVPGGVLMVFKKPYIRKSTYYLLALAVIALNVDNTVNSGVFGGGGKFPVMGVILECVAAILGYVFLRVVISNFTRGGVL